MIRRYFAALALLVAALAASATAQPFAAAGGFARPVLEESRAIAASVSVAVATNGTVTTVWAGPEGVWRLDRTAAGRSGPRLLEATDDVRSLSSAYFGDELAVTWVSRDRTTGLYHYLALVGGQRVELFTDSLVTGLQLFEYDQLPYAAGLFRRDGEGQVHLLSLTTGESQVVYSTNLSQRGLDVLPMTDGRLWLGWLEGRNERGEFGLISEWDARVGLLPAPGATMLGPAVLGDAYVEDERQSVALLSNDGADAGADTVWVLWSEEEDALLRLSEVQRHDSGLVPVSTGEPLGQGRPVGAAWPDLYWVSDASVLRQNVAGGEPLSVAWSPITIEGATFATAAVTAGGVERDLTAVAWYGRAQGGAIEIFATDDRVPMQLTLADRFAALMNWNPWHLWDELLGQLLTALLVGVLAGITLVPILMIVGPLLGRLMSNTATAVAYGLVAGVLPLLGGAWIYSRAFPAAADIRLMWIALAASVVLGLLLGWLVGRRGDREASGTFTVVGALTTFAGAATFSFLTYKQWGPLVGLI
ncbi:MAG: hypothetical protein WDA03_06120 [Trueperaceae bacterium]